MPKYRMTQDMRADALKIANELNRLLNNLVVTQLPVKDAAFVIMNELYHYKQKDRRAVFETFTENYIRNFKKHDRKYVSKVLVKAEELLANFDRDSKAGLKAMGKLAKKSKKKLKMSLETKETDTTAEDIVRKIYDVAKILFGKEKSEKKRKKK